MIDAAVIEAVRAEDSGDSRILARVAQWLSHCNYRGLAILASRAVLPFELPNTDHILWARLFQIRDLLNLAADDPLAPLIDTLREKTATAEEMAEAVAKAKREAEAARVRLREAQETMKRLQQENKRREHAEAAQAATPASEVTSGARIEKEVRQKIEFLTAEWKREHAEKNVYRRKSEEAEKTAEQLRMELEKAQAPAKEWAADTEDDLLLPDEAERNQPVRLIDFPHAFRHRLEESPRHVARGAMSALGGIAAGDPASFIGVKRLKSRPEVMRQRLGDYRLLFQLLPDRVHVIDLVPRQDFERRIKALAAARG
jgi:hypothetical protein